MSEFTLAGHELETPLINAAGSINSTNPEQYRQEVATLAHTAIGAITVGSFTVIPQAGNEKPGRPAYYYDEETQTSYNSMGLPNVGMYLARKILPDLAAISHDAEFPKPLIASVSPTDAGPDQGGSVDQIVRLAYHMQLAGADLIEVNTSCPNVISKGGKRKAMLGYDLDGMEQLVDRLQHWVEPGTVGVKLPPYLTEKDWKLVPRLAELFRESGIFGYIVTSNTIPNQLPIHADGNPIVDAKGRPILPVRDGKGGKSGPSTAEVGREQFVMWDNQPLGDIDKVSALGVDNGREMATRRKIGASAVEGVTFLWRKGSSWPGAVHRMLDEWSEAEQ